MITNKDDNLFDSVGMNEDKPKIKVVKPNLNNERIIAQSGFFTLHYFVEKQLDGQGRFPDLKEMKEPEMTLTIIPIPGADKWKYLRKLNRMNVNHQTIYPGFEGICKQMNWEFEL